MSFNDYAEARGMENAQEWSFYSVNDVTPDGNKFIGAGTNPDGQDVSFLIDFSDPVQTYMLDLAANPVEGGELSGAGEFEVGASVDIEAIANENYDFINWTNESGDTISTEAVTTIIMDENDMVLTANFQATVGISNIIANELNVYPNPASDYIIVETPYENAFVHLFDMTGEVVFEGRTIENKTSINTSELKNGIYIIQVSTCEKLYTTKINIVK